MGEIQSLARGLKILSLLAETENGVAVTEMAEILGVNKSTVSRLIQTLRTYGFVEKASDERRYQLGPTLFKYGSVVVQQQKLREIAKPYLRQLVKMTGECAHLAIYAQGQALYIDQAESEASLRVNVEIGQMAPLHCTALGKVLLAFGGYPIPDPLERFTESTIIKHDVLADELSKIRHHGYAIDDEEYDTGVRCLAAPVFDDQNKLAAAMGISGPVTRITKEKLVTLPRRITNISDALTDQLKFRG